MVMTRVYNKLIVMIIIIIIVEIDIIVKPGAPRLVS